MEIRGDNEPITQLTLRQKRQRKRDMTPYWHDFKIVQLTESHRSRLDGTGNSAHATTQIAEEDHSHEATAEERKIRENSWVLVLNTQGENGPMNQREDYAEATRIKERLYEESGEGNTKNHISKQVRHRESQSFSRFRDGAERIDPNTGWKWYPSTA